MHVECQSSVTGSMFDESLYNVPRRLFVTSWRSRHLALERSQSSPTHHTRSLDSVCTNQCRTAFLVLLTLSIVVASASILSYATRYARFFRPPASPRYHLHYANARTLRSQACGYRLLRHPLTPPRRPSERTSLSLVRTLRIETSRERERERTGERAAQERAASANKRTNPLSQGGLRTLRLSARYDMSKRDRVEMTASIQPPG